MNTLPTVEDGDENASMGSGPNLPHTTAPHSASQPRMKRSPYLSVMAGSTKESEDLVAKLSRPNPSGGGDDGGGGGLKRTGHVVHGEDTESAQMSQPSPMGGGGRSNFFDLKRPGGMQTTPTGEGFDQGSHTVTPVSSAGGEINNTNFLNPEDVTAPTDNLDGSGGGRARSNSAARPQSLQPSLRSALRMSSRSDVKAMAAAKASNKADMTKNTSVVKFSTETKKASVLGIAAEGEDHSGNARFYFSAQQVGGDGGGGGEQQQHGVQFAEQQAQQRQQANLRQFQQTSSQMQATNYSAAAMMKKSQSIAAPQNMFAHKNSVVGSTSSTSTPSNTANESFSQGDKSQDGGGGGNASFPIYFSKLPQGAQQGGGQQPGQQHGVQGAPTQSAGIAPFNSQRMSMRSKSVNTLKYYAHQNPNNPAQELLHAAGMSGDVPPISRPSINGLNLTFKDMLDEGDGTDGDLNLRQRNQQWKDFRSFSNQFEDDNPLKAAMGDNDMSGGAVSPVKEDDGTGSTSTTATGSSIALSGSKRTLTPNSLNSGGDGGMDGGMSRPDNSNLLMANAGGGMMMRGMPQSRTLGGSHRAAVSVNDLAVLRRAAARMKMTDTSSSRQASHKMGETLGGDMLTRLSSGGNSSYSSAGGGANRSPAGNANDPSALSPLAQMMAKNNAAKMSNTGLNRMGSSSSNINSNNEGFANAQQRDLFFQKFNMALSGSGRMGDGNDQSPSPFGMTSSASSRGLNTGMGRRVRTVGAGLAYGRANMTVDMKSGSRLSRFDLGALRKETSRLSEISSTGSSGGGGGGRNEEWDLS